MKNVLVIIALAATVQLFGQPLRPTSKDTNFTTPAGVKIGFWIEREGIYDVKGM